MRVEFDSERQSITVDGVEISFEVLRFLADPDELRYFSFVRRGDIVTCQGFQFDVAAGSVGLPN